MVLRKKKNKNKSGMKRCNEAKGEANESKAHELCPYFHNIPDELYPYFDSIPDVLIIHILLQLPINSLLICKSVCKNWKTLISEPHFTKLHFERAPSCFLIGVGEDRYGHRRALTKLYHVESDPEKFMVGSNDHVKIEPVLKLANPESLMKKNGKNDDNWENEILEFDVLNSCNGLLCLCDVSKRYLLLICNPITREFIRLPEARTKDIVAAGFGFQPKTNEYKVIRIKGGRRRSFYNVWNPILEIHTVGTRSWKKVEMDPQISISNDLRHPTCINGALHWISIDDGQMSILCFNFESERLQSFPSPSNTIFSRNVTMGESRGFLYIYDTLSDINFTMWFMMKYGIGESWTKVYYIDFSVKYMGLFDSYGGCWPIKPFEEGASLFLHDYDSNGFIYFESEKYESKKIHIQGISLSTFVKVISHTSSLISLKDIVKKGDNVRVSKIRNCPSTSRLMQNHKLGFEKENRYLVLDY